VDHVVEYRELQRAIFSHASEVDSAHTVVDSSKSAWAAAGRFAALAAIGEFDVRVVHLVRDGRSTLESLSRIGSNWEIEGHREQRGYSTSRAIVGWLVGNLSVSIAARAARVPYVRLRYEDLLAEPEKSLQRVATELDLNLDRAIRLVQEDAEFEVGHLVGGNRLRFEGNVKLQRRQSATPNWKISRLQRLLFGLTAGWLNAYYGY